MYYEYLIRWRNRFKPGELSESLSPKKGASDKNSHPGEGCIAAREQFPIPGEGIIYDIG